MPACSLDFTNAQQCFEVVARVTATTLALHAGAPIDMQCLMGQAPKNEGLETSQK